jgi:hypothetical protein
MHALIEEGSLVYVLGCFFHFYVVFVVVAVHSDLGLHFCCVFFCGLKLYFGNFHQLGVEAGPHEMLVFKTFAAWRFIW